MAGVRVSESALIVFAIFFANVVSNDCPNGFTRHDQSCYTLIRVKASWAEASVYCSSVGAHLAVVETDTEHSFIKSYMQRESASIDTEGVWLGGLDYLVEGDWQWGPVGSRIDKTWWNPKQPDGVKGEDCLGMYKSYDFNWDDYYCSSQIYFLCELELPTNPIE